jgi:hypothetical protein
MDFKEKYHGFESSRYIQPYELFYSLTGKLPNKMMFTKIKKQDLLDELKEKYSFSENNSLQSEKFNHEDGKLNPLSCFFTFEGEVCLYFNPGVHGPEPFVEILYHNKNAIFTELLEMVKKHYDAPKKKNQIHLFQKQDYGGVYLNSFDINNTDISLSENYNDDFSTIHEIIEKKLNTMDDKGLVLLYGPPGTGKTSYIRYLTSVTEKRIIYLTPDLAPEIASPNFLSLLTEYPNSILVIEDAENVIEDRKGGGNAAMSNLLNLTDGLLADCLKIQVICSFNTSITKIDKALLRKGRLIAQYEFKPLAQEKAKALSKKLGFANPIEKEMTLAEIYNQDDLEFKNEEKKRIGFNS